MKREYELRLMELREEKANRQNTERARAKVELKERIRDLTAHLNQMNYSKIAEHESRVLKTTTRQSQSPMGITRSQFGSTANLMLGHRASKNEDPFLGADRRRSKIVQEGDAVEDFDFQRVSSVAMLTLS
jgi:hypothetical protein